MSHESGSEFHKPNLVEQQRSQEFKNARGVFISEVANFMNVIESAALRGLRLKNGILVRYARFDDEMSDTEVAEVDPINDAFYFYGDGKKRFQMTADEQQGIKVLSVTYDEFSHMVGAFNEVSEEEPTSVAFVSEYIVHSAVDQTRRAYDVMSDGSAHGQYDPGNGYPVFEAEVLKPRQLIDAARLVESIHSELLD